MRSDREEQIRFRAHQIWEREGFPEGRMAEHWDQAIRELEAEGAIDISGSASPADTSAPHAEVAPAGIPANYLGKALRKKAAREA